MNNPKLPPIPQNRNQSKQQLKNKLIEIEKEERAEAIVQHYPEFKKYEGKCFRYRNCYSCPKKESDYWWTYKKVTKITQKDVYVTFGGDVACYFKGYRFQTDSKNTFSVEKIEAEQIHSLGEECSEDEFNNAWNIAMTKINQLP